MNLEARLRALERKTAGMGLRDVCPECGGPSPYGRALVLIDRDTKLHRCPACRHLLDAKGRLIGMLGTDGRVHLKRIIRRGGDAPWARRQRRGPVGM